MTRDETLLLLEKISDAYPFFLKDRDPEKTADLWQQCLELEEADDMSYALIQYMRHDTKNQPPAPGSLLQYVDRNRDHIDLTFAFEEDESDKSKEEATQNEQ